MNLIETPIPGLLIIEPRIFADNRGYFFEAYNEKKFIDAGMTNKFIQDNESCSEYGVIRGLHYQLAPFAQTKLVRVILGTVYDVAVDLRAGSPTFGKWFGVELSGDNKRQLFIPQGFAHGFSVLSEKAIFSYKCDNFYSPENERGIAYNDPFFGIDWKIDSSDAKISEKDLINLPFSKAEMNFKNL
ncbi:MAG: dTDP-4-dehydrorhamnose 3,5-epimerase [Bacteroidota bacterium]|nr:dTDP-4-dehydrorhamnose 3,5-epimerase [Bacteroidota bacterium]MDP4204931.1 dTDP-4-dehydrorhamnose 3,5-epimerase [Bacteroidota bacterium]